MPIRKSQFIASTNGINASYIIFRCIKSIWDVVDLVNLQEYVTKGIGERFLSNAINTIVYVPAV